MRAIDLATILNLPRLPSFISQVEVLLESSVSDDNQLLYDPSIRLLKSGGKRLRPSLALASSMSLSNTLPASVITACSAIELLHISSLVHDDIIDKASVRHGIPTVSAKEGINIALLVGDYLTALSSMQASLVSNEVSYVIANAYRAMCDGQSRELVDTHNVNRTVESYLTVIRLKTAMLMSAACRIGGTCAEMSPAQIEALGNFGAAFGMSFQLIDDLIDLLSTTKDAGKPVGNDLKEGVYTLPILYSLQGSSKKQVKAWLGSNAESLPARTLIVSILQQDGSIARTLHEIQKYNAVARDSLADFKESDAIIGLKRLPNEYFIQVLPRSLLVEVL